MKHDNNYLRTNFTNVVLTLLLEFFTLKISRCEGHVMKTGQLLSFEDIHH